MTPEEAEQIRLAREALYEQACREASDINEHLPLLRELASKCSHVTEMGMRGGVSTLALLAAQPKALVSWDLNPLAIVSQRALDLLMLAGATAFQPRCGDTLKISPIEATDLLFIDTLHTGKQLYAELCRHVEPRTSPLPVRKYLVFHDTATFGRVGEDGQEPGLLLAIREFYTHHAFPHWKVTHNLANNNGLAVLEHVCANGHNPRRINGHCVDCATRPPEGE